MANEAVIIELLGNGGDPVRFTVADGATIEKGTLLKLTDPRTAIASSADNDPFCGIAAAEKVASDGSVTLAAYTKGIFDLKDSGSGITVGATVNVGGTNLVVASAAADLLTGSVVGRALEAASASEVIADTVGQADLRAENVEKIVTGFALQEYRFKQICMISKSSAWQESYYQETAADLSGGLGSAVKGVPRLANFPYGEVSWTKQSSYLTKYGMEGVISWEDAMTNNIDVIARTLLRIGRAVAKAVDDEIWDVISESQSASNINSVTISAGDEWDSATIANRDPIQDILNGKKAIAENNYDPDNGSGFLLLSPKDYANLLGNANIRNAGQFYTDAVTKNGRVGQILGLQIIVSNSVTADFALVVIAKEAATWKEANPLTVRTINDPGVKYTIRAWEIGVTQLVNPKAVTLISNTQA
jgi:hypothetical protein